MQKEEALRQVNLIKEVIEENKKIASKISPYLILWGVISMVGFSLMPVLKSWSGLFWTIAGILGGAISGYIGKKENSTTGKYTALIGKQIGFIFGSMFVGGWALSAILIFSLSKIIPATDLGVLITSSWIVLISMAWFITGVISNNSPYIIVAAVLLLVPSTASAILAPHFFYLAVTVFGGGGMTISGILARNKGR